MEIAEREIAVPWEGFLAEPAGAASGGALSGGAASGGVASGGAAGVLVLAGSSGRVETERCRLLAAHGLTALSIRWFGGPGQPPGICEIPLETFTAAVDFLKDLGVGRVCALGLSKGAEAALLLSTVDPRLDGVVALAPTPVAWANVGAGLDGRTVPYRSSWTWQGRPVPYVPYDETWEPAEPEGAPVALTSMYERSLAAYERGPAATGLERIPVERSTAELLLVAGGDDRMWPSLAFARDLAARREARVVSGASAGHRVRLPGEGPAAPSALYEYGGTPEADAALGAAAWPHILDLLHGTPAAEFS